jgi:hypothetical protein
LIGDGDKSKAATVIESGDDMIMLSVDKKYLRNVDRLFQVGLNFFDAATGIQPARQ